METIHKWFRQEVYRWRTGASITWSLVSLPPVATVYLLATKLSIIHPLQVFIGFFSYWMSWSYIVSILSALFVYFLLILHNSQHFSVLPDIPLTRLEFYLSLLYGSKLIHGVVMSIGTATLMWCFSSFIGGFYSSLYSECTPEGNSNCLNERHLVLILYAFYTGLLHHYTFYSQQRNYLQFLVVSAKIFTVKNSLQSIVTSSFLQTFSALKYFYLLYYLFGSIPKLRILYWMQLDLRSLPPIDSLYGMLDLDLFLQLLFCGTFLRLLWNISQLLYKVNNTEPFTFLIESNLDMYKNKCLHNALSCDTAPLIQHLGFLDLQRLSTHDALRRKSIFSLSLPGGHPHIWNQISATCLGLIDSFSQMIEKQNCITSAMFHMNSNSKVNGTVSNHMSKPEVAPPSSREIFYNFLKTKPIASYFLVKLPDAEIRRLFAHTQTHIWAIDAISNLVCASYSEDPYGIVQRSLPTILSSLLTLHETLEKHSKVTNTSTRRLQDQPGSHDSCLRQTLIHITKTAIYRICTKFGPHLQELNVGDEQLRKLERFTQILE